jgi:arylsulfatase A-like enzyme
MRLHYLLGIALLAMAAFCAQAKPNIILIVTDDQGYRDLGCFGGEQIKTPNLDRLAREGVRGTSFYVTWPACTPSRGSILTGRYPQRNGLYDMIRNDMVNYGHRYTEQEYSISPEMTLGLDVREVVIAQVLKKAGYANGVVGKWDGGRARRFLPLQRGFDFYYGFANTGIDYYTHERYGIASMFRGNDRTTADKGIYATDLFRRESLRFVREHKDKPFFLYIPFNAPHSASNLQKDSYQVPEKWLKLYPDLDPKDKRTIYMAMVSCMDDAVGELLDTLRELRLEKDTLIMFFSDNGGSGGGDNKPLRGGKSSMFEGGIRVPFLARWPARLPAGKVCDEFLTSLEVFPTFCAAAGAKPPAGIVLDGHDMLPVLAGKVKSPRAEMFWQRRDDKAARVGNFKWVESAKLKGLYDLSTDIEERKDLSVEKPDVLARVKARFDAWRKEMDAAEPRGPFRDY